jgi:Tfp pilus assembly protein PilF
MLRFLLAGIGTAAVLAGPVRAGYDLNGRIEPRTRASVSIYSATTPFAGVTLSDPAGRFHFKRLEAGAYTIAVFVAGRGQARTTVEVGPGNADTRNRVQLTLRFKDSDFSFGDVMRQNLVSARALKIPERARREYQRAQRDLEKRDANSARLHLEKAVEIAPQFVAAWNGLGIIAYQSREFGRAEELFRQALAQDQKAYEPLVNLGGVLITLRRLEEAGEYNQRAVALRPNDALANSQLGITYFELRQWNLAEQYLERARELDPAHFSHPQLLLARIHMRRGESRQAADALKDFLQHHPDWPQAQQVRDTIARLSSGAR